MPTILFYAPFNRRSRDTESLMIAFHKEGHRVIFLSQENGSQIGPLLERAGVEVFTHVLKKRRPAWWYYLRHIVFFVSFCRKHRVQIVYSHLEPANFVAAVGQYFISAKTFIFRHHINEGEVTGLDRSLYYRMTYFLAKRIIVVSREAVKYMEMRENISSSKIKHINLGYDFTLYDDPDPLKVKSIRNEIGTDILLLTVGRLIGGKRPQNAFRAMQILRLRGYNAKLILLGAGPMEGEIRKLIIDQGLADCVSFPGYVNNTLEYMAASDFLLHPSLIESSCVVVKEAGLVGLPVIVCRGVGDFDGYLVHGENGFAVDPEKFEEEAVEIVIQERLRKDYLMKVGSNLRATIVERFGIASVINQYDSLNKL